MSREPVDPTPPSHILVMAASTRAASLNQALALEIRDHLDATGASVGLIQLGDYEMPMYHGDREVSDGVPASARALAERIAAAEALVIVSPEYNGAFTPLLKNTVDWLTRVDKRILSHLTVLLASASPGQGGGAKGVAMVAQWMQNMRVAVAPVTLSVRGAELGADHKIVDIDRDELAQFVAQTPVLIQ